MATEGLRRSTRTRKAVKSYAEEQAEDSAVVAIAVKAAPPKRKRKALAVDDEEDDDDEVDTSKMTRKASKKSKVLKLDSADGDDRVAKRPAKASSSKRTATNASWHESAAERRIAVNNRNVKQLAHGQQETRLREYVDDPSESYHDALERANSQKMFILDRERGIEDNCHANHDDCPCETVQIAGSKGNVYTITISHLPSCTCPVGIYTKKNGEKLCKHTLYVLHNVLKVPDRLLQQNAFLTSELKEVFSKAPALPTEVAEDEPMDGNRKPLEDDCPICCMEFEDNDEIVWCRAACGNNVHKGCFDQWARTKMGHVTCPFCRTEWDYGDAPKTQKVNVASVNISVDRGADGYRNVRDQLDYD